MEGEGALTPEEIKRKEVEERKKRVDEMMKRHGGGGGGGGSPGSNRASPGSPGNASVPATRKRVATAGAVCISPQSQQPQPQPQRPQPPAQQESPTTTQQVEGGGNRQIDQEEAERIQRKIQVERLRKRMAGLGELTEEEIQRLSTPSTTNSNPVSASTTTLSPTSTPSTPPTTTTPSTIKPPTPRGTDTEKSSSNPSQERKQDSPRAKGGGTPPSSLTSSGENSIVRPFASAKRKTATLNELATKYKGYGERAGEAIKEREKEKRHRASETERWMALYDRFTRRTRGGTRVEGDEQTLGQPLSAQTIGAMLALLRLESTRAKEEGKLDHIVPTFLEQSLAGPQSRPRQGWLLHKQQQGDKVLPEIDMNVNMKKEKEEEERRQKEEQERKEREEQERKEKEDKEKEKEKEQEKTETEEDKAKENEKGLQRGASHTAAPRMHGNFPSLKMVSQSGEVITGPTPAVNLIGLPSAKSLVDLQAVVEIASSDAIVTPRGGRPFEPQPAPQQPQPPQPQPPQQPPQPDVVDASKVDQDRKRREEEERKEAELQEELEEDERRRQMFMQHWNDQSFKLANLSNLNMKNEQLHDVLQEILSTPARRLSLFANSLDTLYPKQGKGEASGGGSGGAPRKQSNSSVNSDLIRHLQVLILSCNEFKVLPPEIFTFSNLRHFHCAHNRLTEISPDITALTHLAVLDLRGNQLKSLPWELFSLSYLERLDLSQNQLTSLPAALGNLKNLRRFIVSHNMLTSLPLEIGALKFLEELYLAGNQLQSLPETLGFLDYLTYLNIEGNPMTEAMVTARAILGGTTPSTNKAQALVLHYKELISSAAIAKRCKLILLGQEGVGKTALVKALHRLHNAPLKKAKKKQWKLKKGIHISNLETKKGPEEFIYHIWELQGGDQACDAHSNFLASDDRTIYLVLWDARNSENDAAVEYWLNQVHLATSSHPAPVIVVATHLEPKSTKNFTNLIIDKYGKEFPGLKWATAVNSMRGEDVGVPELYSKIEILAKGLCKDIVPYAYLLLENLLKDQNKQCRTAQGAYAQSPWLTTLTLPIVSWQLFARQCQFCGVTLPTDAPHEARQKVKAAAKFLYGVSAIYFHWGKRPFYQGTMLLEQRARFIDEDEEGEGSIQIYLDPKWVVDVVYSIVQNKGDIVNGLLRSEGIAGIWGLKTGGGLGVVGSGRGSDAKKNLMTVVGFPEGLCHRIFEILEILELVWTDFSLSEQNEQFIRKANSLVPCLLPTLLNPSLASPAWVKFLKYLRWEFGETVGLGKLEDINLSFKDGKKKTTRRDFGKLKKSARDQKVEITKESLGAVKFERWWVFKFFPPGLFSLLMVRLLDAYKLRDIPIEENSEEPLLLKPESYWRNGLILSSMADGGKTFLLLQVVPCSDPVSHALRKRERAKSGKKKASAKTKARGAPPVITTTIGGSGGTATPATLSGTLNTVTGERNPWKDVILQLSVWEKDSPIDTVSTFAQALIFSTLNILNFTIGEAVRTEVTTNDVAKETKKIEVPSYTIEIPCIHCLAEGFSSVDQRQESRVPAIFSYQQLAKDIADGEKYVSCDGVYRTRIDFLIPDLVNKEGSQKLITEEEWGNVLEVAAKTLSVDDLLLRKGDETEEGTSVIVKEFQTRVGDDMNSELLNELKRMVWLSSERLHPNILRTSGLYHSPKDPNAVAIVWEKPHSAVSLWDYLHEAKGDILAGPVLGRSTSEYEMRKPKKLTWLMRVRIAIQLCQAMQFLHSLYPPVILHSDLTSKNIMLQRSPEDVYDVPLIADFGMSRICAASSLRPKTGSSSARQTQVSAPELASRSYTERADVYTFGILLWEILTERPPFEGLSSGNLGLQADENRTRGSTSPARASGSFLGPTEDPLVLAWKKNKAPWKRLYVSLISSCMSLDPTERPTFGRILDQLVSLQKVIEPSKLMNVVKNFVFAKRLPTVMSAAVQCMTHVKIAQQQQTPRGRTATPPSTNEEKDNDKPQEEKEKEASVTTDGTEEETTAQEEDLVWCGCGDGSLWIFDALSEELRYSKAAHAKRVVSILPFPEMGQVWTSSVDQTIKIWKAKSGSMLKILGGINDTISCMTVADGNVWCGSLGGKVYVWDAIHFKCKMVAELGCGAVWTLLTTGDTVWVGAAAHIVRYGTNLKQIDILQGHTKPVTALITVGDEIWSGSQDCSIRVWGMDGKCSHVLTEHSLQVYALLYYNENCVWSGSWDKTIIVWNAQTKKPSQVLKGKHDDAISGLVVTTTPTTTAAAAGRGSGGGRDGGEAKKKVWSCSWDRTLSLWE